jgi:Protein of unknown function (DUF2905)
VSGASQLGRVLILLGGVLLALGLCLTLFGRLPLLGRLPGDFVYRRGNLSFYFPLATSLLISVLLTLLLALLRKG